MTQGNRRIPRPAFLMMMTFTLLLGMVITIGSFLNFQSYQSSLLALTEARVQTLASGLQWTMRNDASGPSAFQDEVAWIKSRDPSVKSINVITANTSDINHTEIINDTLTMTVARTDTSGQVIGGLIIRYTLADALKRLADRQDYLVKTALLFFAVSAGLAVMAIHIFYRPFMRFVSQSRESLRLVETESPPSFGSENVTWQEETDFLAFQSQAQTVFTVLHEAEDYGLSKGNMGKDSMGKDSMSEENR